MNPRKIISLLILSLFVLSLLSVLSCSSGGNDNDNDNVNNNENPSGNDAANSENIAGNILVETKPPHEMPEKNYDGYKFKFLVKEFNSGHYWGAVDIFAEEENGDPINDMVYKRNRITEDRYNIEISETRYADVCGSARKVILANSPDYDVIMPDLNGAAPLATQGLFLDVRSELPYLQLDGIWWDQRANQMLSLDQRQYFPNITVVKEAKM